METVFSMGTKFSFHALQTTICLEVKEVDVSARDGIHAYQNAKVGLFFVFSYSLHCGRTLAHGPSLNSHQAKNVKRGDEGKKVTFNFKLR